MSRRMSAAHCWAWAQLSMELRQAPGAEHGRDRAGDALGVEAVGDLGRGAPDDL